MNRDALFAFFRAIVAGTALAALATAAQATTRKVPQVYPNIQAAISAAANGDTVLLAPGVYSGAGNVQIDTLGKAITIEPSMGAGSVMLLSNSGGPQFIIHSAETTKTVISGLDFEYGSSGSSGYGGAVSISASSPKIVNCTFQLNAATNGGGAIGSINGSPVITGCSFAHNYVTGSGMGGAVFIAGGSAKIINCGFSTNTAPGGGGALAVAQDHTTVSGCYFYNNSGPEGGALVGNLTSVSVTNTTFDSNSAPSPGTGGAVAFFNGTPKLTDCLLQQNGAVDGGALYNVSASTVLKSCEVVNNSASDPTGPGGGGGLYFLDATNTHSKPLVQDCVLEFNLGLYGGAINNQNTNITVTDTEMFANTGLNDGGGAYAVGGNDVFTNDLFLYNTASNFFGGGLRLALVGLTAHVVNCSFYGNYDQPGVGESVYATDSANVTVSNSICWDTGGANALSWDGSGFFTVQYSDVYGGFGGVGNENEDPLYQNTGSLNLMLQSTSPCIDAGSSHVADFPKLDITGVPRETAAPDMGAYESSAF